MQKALCERAIVEKIVEKERREKNFLPILIQF